MGHAGAIVSGGVGDVAGKTRVLKEAGAAVAERPRQVGILLADVLGVPS